ncbi:hypothetical protein N7457_005597 [Penicillium paradoxum]|uniref:uncharacterized protein n=1 Tax=Penicillium paradoxum TaxID=176176 RepID=UPI002546A8D2|nr:uncharacterized protein N7457_005597 [Penicillium paradoxum]KAJ5780437.1 hypothetical protein N7457_005597 [Penicillium paradoxum]
MAEGILREEGLPATTPRYQYQGVEQCLRCFELELDHYNRKGQPGDYSYIIFDNVDERSFQRCFEDESPERHLMHSLVTYILASHTAILKMPTAMHSVAHGAFGDIFATWHRGQQSRLLAMRNTTVEGPTRKKCPDSSWKTPVHVFGRDAKWPTILVEAGWSDSSRKLQQDVLLWLRESEQQVKVVLTIKVTPEGKITVERWKLNERAGEMYVEPNQAMRITRNSDASSNQHYISGSMHIQFEDCFLRPKRGSETDFVLSDADMKEIAEAVWHELPE